MILRDCAVGDRVRMSDQPPNPATGWRFRCAGHVVEIVTAVGPGGYAVLHNLNTGATHELDGSYTCTAVKI